MSDTRANCTDCVHAGVPRREPYYSITPPVVHSAPFTFDSTGELIELVEGRSERRQPEYGRMGNPTVSRAEERLAALEGAEGARLFSSGMAAVTTLLLASLRSGDHLVVTRDCYKRTRDFATEALGRFGVRTTVAEPTMDGIRAALEPGTRMVFTETPTNPSLFVVDVEELAQLGHEQGFTTVVDSTFATPVNFRPLEYGVDLVVHSATKYLGGHNDLVAGVLAGPDELVEPVSEFHMTLGAVCDPQTAFLLDRGLKTLSLRVRQHNRNGRRVARFLEQHPRVEKVLYPGLPSHPQHEVADRLMHGFGGVVSFTVGQGLTAARSFVDALRVIRLAPSLGGTESLVEPVVIMGYWDVPREERLALGLPDNMVRLSLGIEETEDLMEDIEQALNRV